MRSKSTPLCQRDLLSWGESVRRRTQRVGGGVKVRFGIKGKAAVAVGLVECENCRIQLTSIFRGRKDYHTVKNDYFSLRTIFSSTADWRTSFAKWKIGRYSSSANCLNPQGSIQEPDDINFASETYIIKEVRTWYIGQLHMHAMPT
jgi:hypothetical protein